VEEGGEQRAHRRLELLPPQAELLPAHLHTHIQKSIKIFFFWGGGTKFYLHGVMAKIRLRANVNSEARDKEMNSLRANVGIIMVSQCPSMKATCCVNIFN
jgi:hypothetical protein